MGIKDVLVSSDEIVLLLELILEREDEGFLGVQLDEQRVDPVLALGEVALEFLIALLDVAGFAEEIDLDQLGRLGSIWVVDGHRVSGDIVHRVMWGTGR